MMNVEPPHDQHDRSRIELGRVPRFTVTLLTPVPPGPPFRLNLCGPEVFSDMALVDFFQLAFLYNLAAMPDFFPIPHLPHVWHHHARAFTLAVVGTQWGSLVSSKLYAA